jgi:hypothetical protein
MSFSTARWFARTVTHVAEFSIAHFGKMTAAAGLHMRPVKVEAGCCSFRETMIQGADYPQARRRTLRFGNSKSRIFILALCSCDFELPTEQSSIFAIS